MRGPCGFPKSRVTSPVQLLVTQAVATIIDEVLRYKRRLRNPITTQIESLDGWKRFLCILNFTYGSVAALQKI